LNGLSVLKSAACMPGGVWATPALARATAQPGRASVGWAWLAKEVAWLANCGQRLHSSGDSSCYGFELFVIELMRRERPQFVYS
jgi:hypothetical protein